jgi:hypothetical protein
MSPNAAEKKHGFTCGSQRGLTVGPCAEPILIVARRARVATNQEKTVVSIRKAVTGAALVGSTLVGGAIGASLIGSANAQTTTTAQAPATSDSNSNNHQADPPADAPRGPHQANGITEQELTGDTKTKAEGAAKAAVPDATVRRSETDAEGAAYEVHMSKSDGTCVTVKEDKDFKVTGIETGGPGGPGHPGRPPQASNTAA